MDFSTLSLADLLAYDFSSLDTETLAAYKAEVASRFTTAREDFTANGGTQAQRDDIVALHTRHGEVVAHEAVLATEAPADEDAVAEIEGLSLDAEEATEEETVEAAEEPAEEPEPVEAATEAPAEPKKTTKTAAAMVTPRPTQTSARIALAGQRPEVPAPATPEELLSITAAADTGLPAGTKVTLGQVDKAWFDKAQGMPAPQGDGLSEDFRYYPLAQVGYDVPDDLIVNEGMDTDRIHEVLQHAADESRLEGGSVIKSRAANAEGVENALVASNGWCAPSEIMYQLPGQETIDGLVDVPEVQVNRGGFKHTTGIAWGTVYSAIGFTQTEAQAISGTTKPCYEVPCPTFTDERLDATGLCIKVPILLQVGYPEMVQNITSRALLAQQVRVNTYVISKMQTLAGTVRDYTTGAAALGSTTVDTLSRTNLVAQQLRQKWRLGSKATIEMVFDMWTKELFREDLSTRMGRPVQAVTDAEILAHFGVRNINPQFVFDWNALTTTALNWPTTLKFMAYPAGTVVKGTAPVINLSSVYDAASLAVNTYTGLFAEQGILVAQMNYEIVYGQITTNQSGRTGAANLT